MTNEVRVRPGSLRALARSHWWEMALLAAAVAYGVGSALSRPVIVIEGGLELATRLDLAVAFMPQGWPTLAALLWAPLVVFRDREAVDHHVATIWSGASLLILAVLAGVGVGWFAAIAAPAPS